MLFSLPSSFVRFPLHGRWPTLARSGCRFSFTAFMLRRQGFEAHSGRLSVVIRLDRRHGCLVRFVPCNRNTTRSSPNSGVRASLSPSFKILLPDIRGHSSCSFLPRSGWQLSTDGHSLRRRTRLWNNAFSSHVVLWRPAHYVNGGCHGCWLQRCIGGECGALWNVSQSVAL